MHGKESKVKRLLAYIQGIRKGKAAHDLEREAMQDPFLQDALDGYDVVPGDHTRTIKKLQNEILKKTEKKKIYIHYYYIAASLLIVFFIGAYFFMYNSDKEKKAIAYQSEAKKRVITISPDNVVDKNLDIGNSAENENKKRAYGNPYLSKNKNKLNLSEKYKNKNSETQSIVFKDNSEYLKRTLPVDDMPQENSTPKNSPSFAKSVAKEEFLNFSIKDINYSENKDTVLDAKKIEEKILTSKVYDAIPIIGEKLYNQYLKNQILLFKENPCSSSKGDMVVCFSVSDLGRPYKVKVIKSLCPELDEKIIELIKNGTDWKGKRGIIRLTQ